MATATRQALRYAAFSSLFAAITVTAEDICSYTTYAYNDYDQRYERMVNFKTCQWGCCWKYTAPCCSPPVGLIVGCVIGGFLLLVLLISGVCCCYYFSCRRQETRRRQGGMVVRYPHQQGGGGVHISSLPSSSSSRNDTESAISTTLPPGVYQPPPSYEEVMAGEINPAFKPDSS